MSLLGAYLTPHPPLIIPQIGRGEEEKVRATIASMVQVGKRIADHKPETVVFITPHGPLFSDGIGIYNDEHLQGDFHRFGEYTLSYGMDKDQGLIRRFLKELALEDTGVALIDQESAKEFGVSSRLDHGILVPLHFIQDHYRDFLGVGLTYGLFSHEENYRVGMALKRAIDASGKKVVIVASGDLSHRLKEEGPYSYSPMGPVFDKEFQDRLLARDHFGIVTMSPELCEKAGECGKRSVDVLLGVLDGMTYTVDRLSYEGPFGVGYAVMAFEEIGPGGKSFAGEILEARKSHVRHKREREDIFVRLARETIETFIIEDRVMGAARAPYEGVALLKTRDFGAFVSIKNSRGLRGCIGTYRPTRENLGEEIIHNALAAATEDPRFDAVTEKELGDLIITVDVLHPPRPVKGMAELDPTRYGVIVRSGYKSGLLLPDLEGVDTPEEQLRIVLSKAGIKPHESYDLEIFEVERHE